MNDDLEVQRRLEELGALVDANHAEIAALKAGAQDSADAAAASRDRADAQAARIDALESRADVDREVIATLKAEGLVSHEHALQLEQALRTSRKIGAAIGIVMAERKLAEDQAFAILKTASQEANRKLRDIADDLVRTGDAAGLVRPRDES
jgi:hypothetical protein